MKIVVLGWGFLGMRLGGVLAAAGHEVTGVSRERLTDDQPSLSVGMRHMVGDVTSSESMQEVLSGAEAVINCVSSSRGGLEVYRSVYLEGTRNVMRVLQRQGRRGRYVHVSSTSVYAQSDGGWVDETSEAVGGSDTSRVLVEAEHHVLQSGNLSQVEPVVVRAAGIYGPGRGHLFLKYLDGEARMASGGEQWINMVHVDDLAAACAMLATRTGVHGIYNAADNEPVTHTGFFEWLSARLGRPMPPPEEPGARVGRKRGQTHKRVSNARLRALDGTWLAHPTFREGYEEELRRLGLG